MKNLKLKPLGLFFNIVVFLLAFAMFGVNPVWAVPAGTVTGVALGFVNKSSRMALNMAIQVEIWEKHVEEAVFDDNQFLNYAVSADEHVVGGRIVHIPQSGGAGNVVKNRTVLPAAVRVRDDSEVLYKIDEYTTDPVRIANADDYELSYDKRNSVLGEDRDNLSENAAEGMLMNWVSSPTDNENIPAANIFTTDGAAVAASAPDATGNRKAYSTKDLQKMQSAFRKQKRWKDGKMICLLTPEAAVQMFPADSVVTATYMQSVTEEERRLGIMYKCQGWKILIRARVYIFDNAGAFKPSGAVGATTDDEGCLFWNETCVEKAVGKTDAFERLRDPQFYGDIYSFAVRIGGRARVKGYKGIMVLKQAKAA